MTLNFDKDAINKKLRIIADEPQDQTISWLSQDVSKKEFPKPIKQIEPFPGACVKTWTEKGEKIFVNICHSKEIHPPEDISDEKFLEELDKDVPNFIIPLAIGIEKLAKDKEDVERPTFDILINTSYFEKCMKKPHFWKFTIQAILDSLNDTTKKSINIMKFVTLKNRKVMGSLDTFKIQDRPPRKPEIKKPMIQVLDSQEENNSQRKPKTVEMKSNEQSNINNDEDATYQNHIFLKTSGQVIGFFYLPSSSVTDITIDVGESRVIVENEKAESMIDTFLPCHIDKNQVTANYDSDLHILRLVLPLKKE